MKKLSIFLLILGFAFAAHAQKGKSEALTALGGSCGLLLYNTYLVVGLAADGYSGEVYSADAASEIINEQLGGVETIRTQYSSLIKSGFLTDPKDVQFMKELIAAFDLVENEAKSLQKYLVSGTDNDALAYDADRKTAWAEISRLLGLGGSED